MILATLRLIESKGAHETAHRCRSLCGRIFRYAIATSRAERDPSADLRGVLAPVVHTPRAAVTDSERIGDLLRVIDGYVGHFPPLYALRLASLVFTRRGELRCAEWAEIDLDAAEWVIPARHMKMRQEHVVQLSTQAVETLRAAYQVSGNGRFVFPGVRTRAEPLSNNTINAALRRLGYAKDETTGHGFRALASTRLTEMGWPPDVIERQLAHAEPKQGPGCLQPSAVPAGAAEDDAGVGGVSRFAAKGGQREPSLTMALICGTSRIDDITLSDKILAKLQDNLRELDRE